MKIQGTDENIFAMNISDKGIIFRIYKELLYLKNKKAKMGTRFEQISQKRRNNKQIKEMLSMVSHQ